MGEVSITYCPEHDSTQTTLLHFATIWEWESGIDFLLAQGEDINKRDHTGATPLLQVLGSENRTRVASYLINKGADCSISDHKGDTPLRVSIHKKEWPIAEQILQSIFERKQPLNLSDQDFNLLCIEMIFQGKFEVSRRLLTQMFLSESYANQLLSVIPESNSPGAWNTIKKLLAHIEKYHTLTISDERIAYLLERGIYKDDQDVIEYLAPQLSFKRIYQLLEHVSKKDKLSAAFRLGLELFKNDEPLDLSESCTIVLLGYSIDNNEAQMLHALLRQMSSNHYALELSTRDLLRCFKLLDSNLHGSAGDLLPVLLLRPDLLQALQKSGLMKKEIEEGASHYLDYMITHEQWRNTGKFLCYVSRLTYTLNISADTINTCLKRAIDAKQWPLASLAIQKLVDQNSELLIDSYLVNDLLNKHIIDTDWNLAEIVVKAMWNANYLINTVLERGISENFET